MKSKITRWHRGWEAAAFKAVRRRSLRLPTCKVQKWPKTYHSQMLIHHSAANLQLCTNKPFAAPRIERLQSQRTKQKLVVATDLLNELHHRSPSACRWTVQKQTFGSWSNFCLAGATLSSSGAAFGERKFVIGIGSFWRSQSASRILLFLQIWRFRVHSMHSQVHKSLSKNAALNDGS